MVAFQQNITGTLLACKFWFSVHCCRRATKQWTPMLNTPLSIVIPHKDHTDEKNCTQCPADRMSSNVVIGIKATVR